MNYFDTYFNIHPKLTTPPLPLVPYSSTTKFNPQKRAIKISDLFSERVSQMLLPDADPFPLIPSSRVIFHRTSPQDVDRQLLELAKQKDVIKQIHLSDLALKVAEKIGAFLHHPAYQPEMIYLQNLSTCVVLPLIQALQVPQSQVRLLLIQNLQEDSIASILQALWKTQITRQHKLFITILSDISPALLHQVYGFNQVNELALQAKQQTEHASAPLVPPTPPQSPEENAIASPIPEKHPKKQRIRNKGLGPAGQKTSGSKRSRPTEDEQKPLLSFGATKKPSFQLS